MISKSFPQPEPFCHLWIISNALFALSSQVTYVYFDTWKAFSHGNSGLDSAEFTLEFDDLEGLS